LKSNSEIYWQSSEKVFAFSSFLQKEIYEQLNANPDLAGLYKSRYG